MGIQIGALAFAAVLTGTLGLLLKPVSNETTGEDSRPKAESRCSSDQGSGPPRASHRGCQGAVGKMDGSHVIAFARRLGTFVAGRLREGVARKVQRPSLARTRVLAVLVVALILGVALALRFIVMWGPAGGATTAKAADPPVVMFIDPNSADLWLCDKAVGTCALDGEGQLTVNEKVAGIPSGVYIGSFEFVVYFSGRVVNVTATEGTFLSSTGPTECWQEQTENWLRFGCRSTGGARRYGVWHPCQTDRHTQDYVPADPWQRRVRAIGRFSKRGANSPMFRATR